MVESSKLRRLRAAPLGGCIAIGFWPCSLPPGPPREIAFSLSVGSLSNSGKIPMPAPANEFQRTRSMAL